MSGDQLGFWGRIDPRPRLWHSVINVIDGHFGTEQSPFFMLRFYVYYLFVNTFTIFIISQMACLFSLIACHYVELLFLFFHLINVFSNFICPQLTILRRRVILENGIQMGTCIPDDIWVILGLSIKLHNSLV